MNERHFYAIMFFILLCVIVLMVGIAICQSDIKEILKKIDGKEKEHDNDLVQHEQKKMLEQSEIRINTLLCILQKCINGQQ